MAEIESEMILIKIYKMKREGIMIKAIAAYAGVPPFQKKLHYS